MEARGPRSVQAFLAGLELWVGRSGFSRSNISRIGSTGLSVVRTIESELLPDHPCSGLDTYDRTDKVPECAQDEVERAIHRCLHWALPERDASELHDQVLNRDGRQQHPLETWRESALRRIRELG